MSGNSNASIATLIVFFLLILYIIGGGFMEKKHFKVGHETGIAIIIGLIVGVIISKVGSDETKSAFGFDDTLFFYFCLPPIIFASGFNMRRKRFFENLGYIMLFGLLGTIITFAIFSALTYGFFKSGIIWRYVDAQNGNPSSYE
jgi:sodium/hydrogen exchanger-like protein 6/7